MVNITCVLLKLSSMAGFLLIVLDFNWNMVNLGMAPFWAGVNEE